MLIGSLVKLHVGLHSCLCFSPLEKLFSKCGSTPPRYLLDTLLSVELLKPFSYRNPDSSLIPGGSIELLFLDLMNCCSILARYLSVDKHFLGTYIDSFLTPLDTSFVELYWRFYLSLLVRSDPYFTRYLSRLLSVFSLKLSHLIPISILKGFFKLFQDFLLLVSF